MATPDAALSGRLPWLIDRIGEHRLLIEFCVLIPLSGERMKSLYQSNRFLIEKEQGVYSFSWKLHEPLFAYAPGCLFLVSSESGSAARLVKECKGSTRPELAAPGTIRSVGENIIFNLAHCPDSPEDASHELKILLGSRLGTRAGELMSERTTTTESRVTPPPLHLLLECALPIYTGSSAISFPATMNRVIARLLQRIAFWIEFDEIDKEAYLYICEAVDANDRVLQSSIYPLEKFKQFRDSFRGIREALTSLVRVYLGESVENALLNLGELLELHGRREYQSLARTGDLDIFLSQIEQMTIESHYHSFQSGAGIDHLYR